MPRLRMLLLVSCVALLGAALTHAQCVYFDCDAAVRESLDITCESLEIAFGMDCTGCNCSTIVDAEYNCDWFYLPASLFAVAMIVLGLVACLCDCSSKARCMAMQFAIIALLTSSALFVGGAVVHCDVPVIEDATGAQDEEEVCGIIYYAFASVFLPIGGIFMYFAFSDVNRGDVNRIASLVFGVGIIVMSFILYGFGAVEECSVSNATACLVHDCDDYMYKQSCAELEAEFAYDCTGCVCDGSSAVTGDSCSSTAFYVSGGICILLGVVGAILPPLRVLRRCGECMNCFLFIGGIVVALVGVGLCIAGAVACEGLDTNTTIPLDITTYAFTTVNAGTTTNAGAATNTGTTTNAGPATGSVTTTTAFNATGATTTTGSLPTTSTAAVCLRDDCDSFGIACSTLETTFGKNCSGCACNEEDFESVNDCMIGSYTAGSITLVAGIALVLSSCDAPRRVRYALLISGIIAVVLGVTLLLVGGYGCSETSASPANATCPGQCDSLAASCAVLEAEYGLDCSGCACTIADCADSVAMYGSGAAVLLCGIAIGTLGVKAQSFPVVASGIAVGLIGLGVIIGGAVEEEACNQTSTLFGSQSPSTSCSKTCSLYQSTFTCETLETQYEIDCRGCSCSRSQDATVAACAPAYGAGATVLVIGAILALVGCVNDDANKPVRLAMFIGGLIVALAGVSGIIYAASTSCGVLTPHVIPDEETCNAPATAQLCNPEMYPIRAFALAGYSLLAIGIVACYTLTVYARAARLSGRHLVPFMVAGFCCVVLLLVPASALLGLWSTSDVCDDLGVSCANFSETCGAYFCVAPEDSHDAAATALPLCEDFSAVVPTVVVGSSLTFAGLYVLVLTRLLLAGSSFDESRPAVSWAAGGVIIIGLLCDIAAAVGVPDGCAVRRLTEANPTALTATVATVLTTSVGGVLFSAATWRMGAKPRTATFAAAASVGILVFAGVPAFELYVKGEVHLLSTVLGYEITACQTTPETVFFFTLLTIGLATLVVMGIVIIFQARRTKRAQNIVIGSFCAGAVLAFGGAVALERILTTCIDELRADVELSGDIANGTNIPYDSVAASAREWDLASERECSGYISSIAGFAPFPRDLLESELAYFNFNLDGYVDEDTPVNTSAVDALYEPFCQGRVGSWSNVGEQLFFRRVVGQLPNLCAGNNNSQQYFLKFRSSDSTQEVSSDVPGNIALIFGWSAYAERTLSGFEQHSNTSLGDYCREQLFDLDPSAQPSDVPAPGFVCIEPSRILYPQGAQPVHLDDLLLKLARQVNYNDGFPTLLEAVDACAQKCSCTGIILAARIDDFEWLYTVATVLVVLIVVAVAAVWGCTAAGLRWAVPCFRIFLEEQDNVVLRHKAEKKMAARMRQDQKLIHESQKPVGVVQFVHTAPEELRGSKLYKEFEKLVEGANFTPDNSVITVDVFNAWTKRHPGAVEAAFYMAPKPGDGIEDDSITVTVANGAVVRAYPPEWEHLVKLARSICDGLYIISPVFKSLIEQVSEGVATKSIAAVKAKLNPSIIAAVTQLFQEAQWYYRARQRRAFTALQDPTVLATLVSRYKEIEDSAVKKSYEEQYHKLVIAAPKIGASFKTDAPGKRAFHYSDTRKMCHVLTSRRYRKAVGLYDSSRRIMKHKKRIRMVRGHGIFVQGDAEMSIVDLYIAATVAIEFLQSSLDTISKAVPLAEPPKAAPLKNMWRIAEKTMARTDKYIGQVIFVNDVCRAQVVCNTIHDLHNAFATLAMKDNVVVVRIKDRFSHPASGGWSDIMVNFYHTNDPNRHTCEIQFCLSHMLNVRAEGGGHHDFHMFRGSAEVLEQCHYEHQLLPRNCITVPTMSMRAPLRSIGQKFGKQRDVHIYEGTFSTGGGNDDDNWEENVEVSRTSIQQVDVPGADGPTTTEVVVKKNIKIVRPVGGAGCRFEVKIDETKRGPTFLDTMLGREVQNDDGDKFKILEIVLHGSVDSTTSSSGGGVLSILKMTSKGLINASIPDCAPNPATVKSAKERATSFFAASTLMKRFLKRVRSSAATSGPKSFNIFGMKTNADVHPTGGKLSIFGAASRTSGSAV